MKIPKKNYFFFWGGGGRVGGWGVGLGGQGRYEWGSEVFVKIQKTIIFFLGGGWDGGVRLGGQDGCEWKCFFWGRGWGSGRSGWGVRMNVNEEFKFL